MAEPVLQLEDLTVRFHLKRGKLTAVDGVTLTVNRGETFGLVGESGSGKTVTARSIMRLIPIPPGEVVRGQIKFEGENILDKSDQEMRALRGKKIAMVFQEPMSALNPVFTIGSQITELQPLEDAFVKMRALVERLRAAGQNVQRLDLGGGLGVPYFNMPEPPSPAEYAAMVGRVMEGLDVHVAHDGLVAARAQAALQDREAAERDRRQRAIGRVDEQDLHRRITSRRRRARRARSS